MLNFAIKLTNARTDNPEYKDVWVGSIFTYVACSVDGSIVDTSPFISRHGIGKILHVKETPDEIAILIALKIKKPKKKGGK